MLKYKNNISSCLLLSALLLTISYAQSIDYLSPSSGQQNVNDLEVHLYTNGVNYYDQYSFSNVYFSGNGINTSSLSYLGSNHFRFYVDINSNAETDNRDVYLNVNGWELVKYNGFTVIENTSGITSISPSEVQAGGQYQINIYASGVNFTDPYGSSSFQSLNFSGGGIDISNTQVYSDWIQTTIEVDMLTSTYARDLSVYTNDYTYTLEDALTITEPDPIEIVSISPNSGYQGTDNLLLDIILNNATFMDMYSNTSLIFSGSGISPSSISGLGDNDNEFQVYIDIASWADIGTHDVTLNVSWQESMSATLYEGFTVNETNWELVSLDPNDSYQNVGNQNLILYGFNTNWGCCGTPELQFEGSGINVDWVTVIASDTLAAQIDIYSWASYGYRDVKVTSGDQMVNLQDGFHVKPPDAELVPNQGYPNDNFQVSLYAGGVDFNDMYGTPIINFSGSGLNVSNVELTSNTSLTFYLQIGDAEPGMRDLYINQYDWLPDYSFDDVFEVFTYYDCNGDYNGYAYEDDCGVCSGGSSGHEANSDLDCAGECFGGAQVDECGLCNGDNSSCSGCTDQTALNYNADATIDDDSCEYLAYLIFGELNVGYDGHSVEILLDNPNYNLGGFQFTLIVSPNILTLTDVSGGLADSAGFTIDFNPENNIIVGYNLEGGTIDEEYGVLTNLDLNGFVGTEEVDLCITAALLTDPSGENLYDVDVGGCITIANQLGDTNIDGVVNILDVVFIVNLVLQYIEPTEYEQWAADINADGSINIQDIVLIINIILTDDDLARRGELTEAEIKLSSGKITILSDGTIAGVELHTSGDYTITGSALPGGWEYYNNNDIILIVDMAGTGISEDITLYYDGTMQIKNNLLSDWSGNGISASLNIIPDTYILESAYPNPFNPTTTLSFALPMQSDITIFIYNLQGREIASLVNGNMEAGYHTAVWNADAYSSGVYFVKMIAGDYISTQKLMLVK